MDTDDDIPEDKLLEMPEQALPDGLSRLWAIRSGACCMSASSTS